MTIIPNAPDVKLPDITKLANLPDEWREQIGAATLRADNAREELIEPDQPGNVRAAIEWLRDGAEIAIEGKGGDGKTYQVACQVREDFGLSEQKTFEIMAEVYNDRCEPPWPLDALATKVRNAYSYAQRSGGAGTAQAEFGNDPIDADAIQTIGDPKIIAQQIADRARDRAEGVGNKKNKDNRPRVVVENGKLHVALDKTQAALLKEANRVQNANGGSVIPDQLFQRGGALVRLSRNLHKKTKDSNLVDAETQVVDGVVVDAQYQEKNALTIVPVKPPWLATRLTRAISYGKLVLTRSDDGKTVIFFSPIDVPMRLVNQMIDDSTQWSFAPLSGTIEAPTLRPDGSILDVPGYDPASGLFFDPGDTVFPKINPNPTRAEGAAAIKYLDEELLSSFPFEDHEGYEGVSRSVALALMLTAVTRRSFPTAPAFAADSNEPESGKSMLLKAAGALMTGREIAGRPFANNEEERRKAIGTALLEGRPVLFFDNADGVVIEGSSLEMALTTPMFEDRKLGSHEGIAAPTNALAMFSANHITVGGTGMTTRIYVARIVPQKSLAERLADREFRHADLIGWVIANRPQLIAAALTALRAFVIHGKAEMPPSKSRFVEWGNMIGNAMLWYGYRDPVLGADGIKAEDPVKEAMGEVMHAWRRHFRLDAVRAADLCGCPEVRDTMAAALGIRPIDVTPHLASGYVKKMVGVRLGQPYGVKSIAGAPGRRYTKRWQLVQTISDDDLPDPLA